jgi:hypothetical protein
VLLDEIARTRQRLDELETEILELIKDLRDDLAQPDVRARPGRSREDLLDVP